MFTFRKATNDGKTFLTRAWRQFTPMIFHFYLRLVLESAHLKRYSMLVLKERGNMFTVMCLNLPKDGLLVGSDAKTQHTAEQVKLEIFSHLQRKAKKVASDWCVLVQEVTHSSSSQFSKYFHHNWNLFERSHGWVQTKANEIFHFKAHSLHLVLVQLL